MKKTVTTVDDVETITYSDVTKPSSYGDNDDWSQTITATSDAPEVKWENLDGLEDNESYVIIESAIEGATNIVTDEASGAIISFTLNGTNYSVTNGIAEGQSNETINHVSNETSITVEKTWEGTTQEDAVITVKVKRYKLVDRVGSLTVTPDITANGYDFQATYSVYDPSGELIDTFTDEQPHTYENLKVGTYTVTETLDQADPEIGYTASHDPAFESGSMTHSMTVWSYSRACCYCTAQIYIVGVKG